MRLYYAQNKEDLLIKSFFPDVKKGFYIDVGANDPVIDSVTKLFYDSGWSGINIEPIKKHIDALGSARPRDRNLQLGLSDTAGKLNFREYQDGDGLSTFDATMQARYKQDAQALTNRFKDYTVELRTLQDVISSEQVTHVHFIKIDVEGYEYEVLSGYDWKAVRPELLCVEANHIHKDWFPLLKKHDYTEVFFDGVNAYFLARESLHRKDFFDYPSAVFAGNPVYYPAFKEIEAQAKDQLGQQLDALRKELKDQEQQITFLYQQQRDIRFLAKRLGEEVQARLNNRAHGRVRRPGLTYTESKDLHAKLKAGGDRQSLESFIHQADKKNIRQQRASAGTRANNYFWKIAATSFGVSLRVAKKLGRSLHG